MTICKLYVNFRKNDVPNLLFVVPKRVLWQLVSPRCFCGAPKWFQRARNFPARLFWSGLLFIGIWKTTDKFKNASDYVEKDKVRVRELQYLKDWFGTHTALKLLLYGLVRVMHSSYDPYMVPGHIRCIIPLLLI